MNQEAQTKMTMNETPSPLELAHLSIALVQAGMLPPINLADKPRPPETLVGTAWNGEELKLESLEKEKRIRLRLAMEYFETCSRMLDEKREEEMRIISVFKVRSDVVNPFREYLKKNKVEGRISVEKLVQYCKFQRVKLSPDELQEIGESKEWDQLTKVEKITAIFLLLTNRQTPETRNMYGSLTPIETRRIWAHDGVPSGLGICEASLIVEVMLHAKRHRQSEKGTAGAEIKRSKPRAPKGDDGKFESKARSNKGKFIKQ